MAPPPTSPCKLLLPSAVVKKVKSGCNIRQYIILYELSEYFIYHFTQPGGNTGGAVRPRLAHLRQAVHRQDARDREQDRHLGELCRGQEYSQLEDSRWV